ncbi:MAG TPA: hypothetical protein VNR67_07720 [Solirubrobacterales bacterium]|nr:hypothetical protein [Solirubrobacterales bacterium]
MRLADRHLTLRVFAEGADPASPALGHGNLEAAQKMTQDVIEGALPRFYFHERG